MYHSRGGYHLCAAVAAEPAAAAAVDVDVVVVAAAAFFDLFSYASLKSERDVMLSYDSKHAVLFRYFCSSFGVSVVARLV